MLVIFNKAPCTDRNESMINETVEKREADFQVCPSPYKRASLPSKALPHKPLRCSTEGGQLPKAVLPPGLPRLRGPSEAAHHLPLPRLSCLPFFITQQMTYVIGVPPASSCCQPSARIKPAILFIFILLPFPSSAFFLKTVCQHCLLGGTQWNRQCLLN